MGETGELTRKIVALRQENGMLRNFVDASKDALFCIEFKEPVDLTAPESEIVRQVFENECVWRMCNTAMARLYKLPEDQDFNAQDVHVVFPHNPENEEFVRTLITADFNIDGVMSLDGDYDGREIYMENDIRANIVDGKLYQMFGAVRNISEQKRREQSLSDRLSALSNVLSAIPDPVLVIDSEGVLQAANPALEWEFGWHLDDVLGQHMNMVVEFPDSFSFSDATHAQSANDSRIRVGVRSESGQLHRCEAHVSSFGGVDEERRIVVTLRNESASYHVNTHKLASSRVLNTAQSNGSR